MKRLFTCILSGYFLAASPGARATNISIDGAKELLVVDASVIDDERASEAGPWRGEWL